MIEITRNDLESLLVKLLQKNQLDFCNTNISHLNISQLADYIIEKYIKYKTLQDLLINEYIVWNKESLTYIEEYL